MSQLIDNLNTIKSIKSDIKSAIENKGVDMTGVSFGSYADKIGEISGGGQFITEPLNITSNGIYTPGQGVDGFSTVTVDVPQSVTGYTQKDITEGACITNLNNSASFVRFGAFAYTSCLTTVDLPNCVSVGDYAFRFCHNLQTVSLPACTIVNSYAFQFCSSLQTVSLPACTSVGGYAFQYCSSLQTVSLPACTIVNSYAFLSCSSLQTVSLPACTSVGGYAFQYCSSLQTVSLPACTSVGGYAFQYCSSLQTVSLPACTSVGGYAFQYCSSLQTVSLPVCSYINYAVFTGCYSLTSISLPVCSHLSGVTYVPGCFEGCINLQELTIGTEISTVCVLGNSRIFSKCSALTSIYVPTSLVESYKAATNWTFYSDKIVGI